MIPHIICMGWGCQYVLAWIKIPMWKEQKYYKNRKKGYIFSKHFDLCIYPWSILAQVWSKMQHVHEFRKLILSLFAPSWIEGMVGIFLQKQDCETISLTWKDVHFYLLDIILMLAMQSHVTVLTRLSAWYWWKLLWGWNQLVWLCLPVKRLCSSEKLLSPFQWQMETTRLPHTKYSPFFHM